MNKQQLAAKIWESANQMRSKIEANEYKDYILGFIFYKYLSEKQLQFLKEEEYTTEEITALNEEQTGTVNYIKENNGYFIAYHHLFSTWITKGRDFDVSDVRDALSAFSRLINDKHKKLFEGIFETLETGLSKLGESAAKQTKAISDLLHLIKDIPMDAKQDYDVLGFIYEYLIQKFASNAGKKAGEFYTPHEVSVLMSEIVSEHLKDRETIQIYDSASGSGSLLINIGNSIAKYINNKNKIKYYAQELKKNTYNLTRMNLIMRGISVDNIVTRNGDTLEDDWPYFEENDPTRSYSTLYVDAVVSNPPYSQKWDPSHKEADPRYSRFGLAPKAKADYAFLLHDLYHLKPNGIMNIVLPHGVLFRGGVEGTIRKELIENNHIDAIIGLPPSIFYGTGIPTIIIILKQKRKGTDVLIIDAAKGFVKDGKNNKLRASDIKRIADAIRDRVNIPKYAQVVTKETIRENEYNLNIPRYVDSAEPAENWDIYASMFGGIPVNELDELQTYWQAFPTLRTALFTKNTEENVRINVANIQEAINNHSDVKSFIANYQKAFTDFTAYLKTQLLQDMLTLPIAKEKEVLSTNIFQRLESIPLIGENKYETYQSVHNQLETIKQDVEEIQTEGFNATKIIDKYKAYQLLDNQWETNKQDLEVIQTEGFEATTQVDPNMVLKKKKGKEEEVQEGWKGRIMPFNLVQKTYLTAELEAIQEKENRLATITATYEELFETLDEDDKENETINDAKDGFVNALVVKEAKQLQKEEKEQGVFAKETYEYTILTVNKLIAEEKKLKREVKTATEALHIQTKTTIEGLTDEQVYELLEYKWITPIVNNIAALPHLMLQQLTTKLEQLASKYATTYAQVATEINEAESTLATLIDELEGDAFDIQGLQEFKKLLNN